MLNTLTGTFKRIIYRDTSSLERYAQENEKVCMIVWNTFETDARVTKEAKTLIKAGKRVTVIAVHDIRRTERYEVKEEIRILRVDRTLRKKKSIKQNSVTNTGQHQVTHIKKQNNLKSWIKKTLKKLLIFAPKCIVNVRFVVFAFRERAGTYHAHDLNTLIPAFIVTRLQGAKLIYDAHEVSTDRAGWSNKKVWEWIESYLTQKADKMITTNKTRAEFFAYRYNIEQPEIIRNVPCYTSVVNSNRIREECSIPKHEPVILYQGGVQRERGLENIIKVIPLVKRGYFVFIGNGALKPHLIQLVKEMKLEHRTYFMDAVPMDSLLSYTASADMGLQLLQNTCFNHYSACSNKLYEYLMAGIPVISSDLPELREVILNTETGTLVDPEHIEGIAKAINELLEDHQRRDKYRRNTAKAAELYQWEHEEPKLLEIYNIR